MSIVARVFGDNARRLSKEQERRYYSTNGAALDAFLGRKAQGLGLSERVWRYADAFKSEIEMGLDLGIRTGEDAARMARSLRQYLRHPDKLFRRVRDQHGNLRLSKAAKAYHPGRGVYRSSYRNARRLAVTETNMAYHTADHLRWQQMDFVVGIEIRLSGNHTVNGLPLTDICDELAGRYPKDFKFTGWHPHCRCRAVAVLKTEEEMAEDTKRILAGEQPLQGSVNAVREIPDAFGRWIEANADRIERATIVGTIPFFISDNRKVVERIMEGEKKGKTSQSDKSDSGEKNKPQGEEVGTTNVDMKANATPKQTSLKTQDVANNTSPNIQNVKTPLTDAQKQRRAEIRQIARETIVDKPILIPGINRVAMISSGKIKEWLNQPHKHILEKNEALLNLPELIKNGKYEGCGVDEHDPTAIAHLVKVDIAGEDSWVIIRELNDGKIGIHSISDNPSIVDKIIKKKP